MELTIKLFASLRKYGKEKDKVNVPDGMTVRQLLQNRGVPLEEAPIVLINGLRAEPEAVLKDGDGVSIFPLIGGG
ncbi:MAG TPA: MoaD/ThiS family protein [Desulfobacteria bacterium]|nr:MoaD/ThiS family protein [Desulfobacteria bacterium]